MRAARTRRHYALALYAAWHAEMFARCERLPDLALLIERLLAGAVEQDAAEQLDAARAIAATFGTTSLGGA
jgi:hypothetical protein